MKTASSTTNLIASFAIAGAFIAGFATGPAFAQEKSFDTDTFKFRFTYQSEELTAAPSAEKLLARLQRQVRSHCDGDRKMTTLHEQTRVNVCVKRTMQESIGKFGSSTLAQAYETRTGG